MSTATAWMTFSQMRGDDRRSHLRRSDILAALREIGSPWTWWDVRKLLPRLPPIPKKYGHYQFTSEHLDVILAEARKEMSVNTRKGITLVEALVVLAIAATLVATVASVLNPPQPEARKDSPTITPVWARTRLYEGHWWVTYGESIVHHPDCPCQKRRRIAEAEE